MSTALVGVPLQRRQRILDRLTVPGALSGAAARWMYNEALNRNQGIAAVETGIDRFAQDGSTNPYHKQIATTYYDVASLGDMEGEWTDIAKVFVGEVAKGIGGRISGKNPYVTQAAPAPAAPETPKWVAPVVIGGGVLVLGTLLLSMRRR